MDVSAASPAQNAPAASTAASGSGAGAASGSDDAAVFEAMAKGLLTTGLSLMNSVVGDTIAAIGEPFGDPEQQPF